MGKGAQQNLLEGCSVKPTLLIHIFQSQGVLGSTEAGMAAPQDSLEDIHWGYLHSGATGAEGSGMA